MCVCVCIHFITSSFKKKNVVSKREREREIEFMMINDYYNSRERKLLLNPCE